MQRNMFLTFIFCLTIGLVNAQEKLVTSPDGKLVISVSAENGLPTYGISYNGKQFLKKSPLGMETLKIKLPMFVGNTELMVYSDDAQLNGKVSSVKLGKKLEFDLSIPSNGGVVIVN